MLRDSYWIAKRMVSIFSIGNVMAYFLAKDWGYDISRFNDNFMRNI